MPKKPNYNNQQEHLEDILKLSQGKRTSRRIGSRSVPHRLNKEEQQDFQRALEKGWLSSTGLRTALWNTFREYQHAQGQVAIIHEKTPYLDRLYYLVPQALSGEEITVQVRVNPLPQVSWTVETLDWGWCWHEVPRDQIRQALEIILASLNLKNATRGHHVLDR